MDQYDEDCELVGATRKFYMRLMDRGHQPWKARKMALQRKYDRLKSKERRKITRGLISREGRKIAKGLSNSRKKWFIHYMNLGLSEEAARRKLNEYVREPEAATSSTKTNPPQCLSKPGGTDEPLKKATEPNDNISPPPSKKPNVDIKNANSTAKPATSRKTKAAISRAPKIHLALLPRNYPARILSADEFTQLEDAINEEVAQCWVIEPEYSGIYFEKGILFVKCDNQETVDWLKQRVPALRKWQGVKVRSCPKNEIPKYYTIKIFLPKSTAEIFKAILLIDAQNEGIRTAKWNVINKHEVDKGHELTIVIDEQSFELIKGKNYLLSYRFGKIKVEIKGEGVIIDEDEDDVMELNIQPDQEVITSEDSICEDSEEEEQQPWLGEEQIKEEPNIEKLETSPLKTLSV